MRALIREIRLLARDAIRALRMFADAKYDSDGLDEWERGHLW